MEETKALVGSIQKFSTEDGPGVRTTVFLKGCPLDCLWCHNPEMIAPGQQMIISPGKCIGCQACQEACPNSGITVGEEGPAIVWDRCESCCACADVCYAQAIVPVAKWMTVSEVMALARQDKSFYDNTGGGVTISGGEMLMHDKFSGELIDACGREGIDVCLDTSGFADYDVLYDLAARENVTAILYDMKQMDDAKHREYTGVSNEIILDNLAKLAADPLVSGKLWMRMPLIGGLNDDETAIERAAEFYRKNGIKKVSLILYHQLGNSKARHIGRREMDFSPPTRKRTEEIEKRFKEAGMETEIIGNAD